VHSHSGLTVAEVFAGLAPRTLQDFEALGQKGTYPPGATLFDIGETCNGVFWVSSGQVRLSVSDPLGQRVMSHVAQPGELLGLKAALCGELHEATARTEGPSEVNFLSRDSLSGFLSSHPDATFRIVQRLSDRLSVAMDQFRLVCGFSFPKPLN
jgi:CRP-like cAMP-binding protein